MSDNLLADLRNRLKNRGGGNRTDVFWPSGDKTRIRLFGTASDGNIPFIEVVRRYFQHSVRDFSYTPVDWDVLLGDPATLDIALGAELITDEDLDMAEEFGDPFGVLESRAEALGEDIDDEVPNRSARFYFPAVDRDNDDNVAIFEAPSTVASQILGNIDSLAEEGVDLLNVNDDDPITEDTEGFDLIVRRDDNASGSKIYPGTDRPFKPTPLGVDPESAPDLSDALRRVLNPYVRPLDEDDEDEQEFLKNLSSYQRIAMLEYEVFWPLFERFELEPSDFGIEDIVDTEALVG